MSEQYMTYAELMQEMDDRDDTYDPEFRTEQDYCDHGTYIGPPGGADILCGWCEDGISMAELREIEAQRAAYERREKTRRRLHIRLALAEKGYLLNDVFPPETIKRL